MRGPVAIGVCTNQHRLAVVVWHRMVQHGFWRNSITSGFVLRCTYAAPCDIVLYKVVQFCACAVLHKHVRVKHSTALC